MERCWKPVVAHGATEKASEAPRSPCSLCEKISHGATENTGRPYRETPCSLCSLCEKISHGATENTGRPCRETPCSPCSLCEKISHGATENTGRPYGEAPRSPCSLCEKISYGATENTGRPCKETPCSPCLCANRHFCRIRAMVRILLPIRCLRCTGYRFVRGGGCAGGRCCRRRSNFAGFPEAGKRFRSGR